jgi:hypothetical protein
MVGQSGLLQNFKGNQSEELPMSSESLKTRNEKIRPRTLLDANNGVWRKLRRGPGLQACVIRVRRLQRKIVQAEFSGKQSCRVLVRFEINLINIWIAVCHTNLCRPGHRNENLCDAAHGPPRRGC